MASSYCSFGLRKRVDMVSPRPSTRHIAQAETLEDAFIMARDTWQLLKLGQKKVDPERRNEGRELRAADTESLGH